MRAEITKEFTFEAAHHLPPVGPDHKCFRLHGHLFRVEITVAGEVDPAKGWVMDFADLARVGREVIGALDHRVLNDFPQLDVPTSENLARFFFDAFAARLPGVVAVTVHESPTSRCTYRPVASPTPPEEVLVSAAGAADLVFSAAHFLLLPPDGREPIHGHDYRAHVSAGVRGRARSELPDVLAAAAADATQDLEHRLLMPATPPFGTLRRDGASCVLRLPAETLALPAADCVELPIANTTTEAIAQVIADRIAANPAVRASGAARIELRLAEGLDASVLVSATV